MLRVYPFQAVRPQPQFAAEVACVPYDVVNREESRREASASPRSFMHVVRPDADLPDSVGAYDDAVYAKGKENLDSLLRDGTLTRDGPPRVYLYRQSADLPGVGRQTQTGVVCCCDVRDYDADRIKKHEKTRKEKEDDRVRHLLTLAAHAEPVFLAHKKDPAISALVESATAPSHTPLYDFTASDGVRHTVWAVDAPEPLLAALSNHKCAYVADGHHRCAAASRAAADRRAAGDGPDSQSQRFLAVLFPADALRILPYHRVVADLNGLSPEDFLGRLRRVCAVAPATDPAPGSPGVFCLFLQGRWWQCRFEPDSIPTYDPVNSLDVSMLSDLVLAPLLNIRDLRTDKRIDFVGGIRGTKELERLVQSGKAAAAFSMHPTTMDQLLAVADAGLMMPPKSTWFEPKLRSGLLIHMLA